MNINDFVKKILQPREDLINPALQIIYPYGENWEDLKKLEEDDWIEMKNQLKEKKIKLSLIGYLKEEIKKQNYETLQEKIKDKVIDNTASPYNLDKIDCRYCEDECDIIYECGTCHLLFCENCKKTNSGCPFCRLRVEFMHQCITLFNKSF